MDSLYDLIDTIKEKLSLSPFNNKVTFGDLTDVDTNKLTAFPLAHIIIERANITERTIDFTVSIVCADIVNASKNEGFDDDFYGNDNVQDILNTQLSVIATLISLLRRLDLVNNNFIIVDSGTEVTAEPFLDRFENELAGWEATMTIKSFNNASIC